MGTLDRFAHPRIAALALAGAGWWVVGLLFLLLGPSHVRGLSTVVHLVGLTLVTVAAAAFGIIWWSDVVRSKLGQ